MENESEKVNNEILFEKWRPKTFEDIIGLDPAIPKLMTSDMPHLILIGSPGTGKTTCAQVIMRTMLGSDWRKRACILNASDERGIDIVRNKVKSYAMSVSAYARLKIVHLDEADKLTPDAQDALRNLMETYARNCRFILTGNYENLINDALKSRGKMFRMRYLPEDEQFNRLKKICAAESIMIEDNALLHLIKGCNHDQRRLFNELQTLKTLGRNITIDDIQIVDNDAKQIWRSMMEKKFFEAKKVALNSTLDFPTLIHAIKEYALSLPNEQLSMRKKGNVIEQCGESQRWITRVAYPEDEFEYMLKRIITAFNTA